MGWVVNATPRLLYSRERNSTHCIGGWVGPRAGLGGCGKSRPPLGFDPRTVQPVASRYTDWAIPVQCDLETSMIRRTRSLSAVEPFKKILTDWQPWILSTYMPNGPILTYLHYSTKHRIQNTKYGVRIRDGCLGYATVQSGGWVPKL